MNNQSWIEFLKAQGATINEDVSYLSFPQQGDGKQPRLVPLIHLAVLSLEGPDGETFLQGQLSCDVRQLSTENSLLGSNCTPKGNVISAFRLIKRADQQLLLRLPQAIRSATLANLGKYIVFSKAELAEAGDRFVGIGLQGEGSEALIATLFGSAPETDGSQLICDDQIIVRVPGQIPRFELWLPADQAPALWPRLQEHATPASTDSWQLEEIRAGLVQLDEESVDTYLPQMLNLQALEGVSFNKGCYTGQEVITRLQYRGKLKKLLYRARVEGPVIPAPGMSLHSASRKGVGKVLAAASIADDGFELQAVISKSVADSSELHLDSQDGPVVELLELPYQIDPELFER